jgi:hypothetical protein
MSKSIYDIETCSEKYKEHIRGTKYGTKVEKTTKENIIFIYNDKKYTISFVFKFAYDCEDGFFFTKFSDFKSRQKIEHELMDEFINHIKTKFITLDRLSL